MEMVYTSQDFTLLGHLQSELEGQGIECVVRGQHLLGGIGELPPIECWPELWVVDKGQGPEARAHIEALLAPAKSKGSPWICDGCGEENPVTFSECWHCGEEGFPLKEAC